MAKDIMFLVRDDAGRCRPIMAPSSRQAVKLFLERYPASPGDEISVKQRGVGDWEEYEVK